MNILDKRLWQARSFEDLLFRFRFNEMENYPRRSQLREGVFYSAGSFVAPDTNRIWGPDVSHWDGDVNLQITKDFGASFVIIKAIDGTIANKYWKANTERAIAAKLLHGPYAWLYPDRCVSCTLQAQAYHNLIKDTPISLPPVLDYEWTRFNGQQANPNYSDLRKWLVAFIRLSGVKPILYTAAGYIALFGAIPADILDMLAGIWVASYGGIKPLMPKGVGEWDMWQFTANGDALTLCPGNQGKRELDLNYMTEAFYSRYAGEIVPPTETGETMAKNKVTVTFDQGAREREQPHAAGVYGSILPDNSIHYSDFDPIPDMDDPTNPDKRWIKLQSGWHIATRYPSSGGILERARVEPIVTTPVDEVSVNVNLDLTATINGKQYHGEVVLENVQLEAV